VSELAHWDCWGSCGEMEHVNKPVPNSTPEAAMDELLSKARFVFGDQDWSAWTWEAREFGTREARTTLHLARGNLESRTRWCVIRVGEL